MNESKLLNSAICHEPIQLRGRALASLKKSELFCTSNLNIISPLRFKRDALSERNQLRLNFFNSEIL